VTGAFTAAVEDPIGLMVSLVASTCPELDLETIRSVVSEVAGGRAKSRRLATVLAARPAVLTDGLSPAPRGLGELLISLRHAGASSISPPRCARCHKELGSLQRRGEDWLCSVCGASTEACSECGNLRRIATRDRRGRPRCGRCPDLDGRDPIAVIGAKVRALQPDADAELVAEAVRQVAPRPSRQRRLAWAIEDNPALLSGAGSLAPLPAVLRLIEALDNTGVTGVVRPACGRCGRNVRIAKPLDGQRVCRSCIAKSRVERCSRCGALREPATRDEHGLALCPNCLITDPANLETCLHCGRRRRVSARGPHGPLCPTCPPLPVLACSICGASAPCGISRLTGEPWCVHCQHRSARCAGCGELKPVRSGTLSSPRCAACTEAAFPDCATCNERPRAGSCPRCRLDRRLGELLCGPDGSVHPALAPLHDALGATDPPGTALHWLQRTVVATCLADIAAGHRQVSHEELDGLPQSPTLAHLRAVLVATGTLPPRDEHMAQLERLLHELLATRDDPSERQLLTRYAVWHLLRRLRRRNGASTTTHAQLAVARQQVRAAIVLLDWLRSEHLTLTTVRQADLERWLLVKEGSDAQQAGHFVRWAVKQRLCDVSFPATRWQGPGALLDDQARFDLARRLLHDTTINPRDRLAGLLVLLYAQKTAAVSRLTIDRLEVSDQAVRLWLGTSAVVLPEPLAALATTLAGDRHGHATTGADGTSPWLFPGGQPGRPISAGHLGQRLKMLGIHPGQARSTALFQLASELPAALLARLLGIHISVAVAWQRASTGDWMSYAADVSRRDRPVERS